MDESPPTPAMADPSEVVWSHAEDVARLARMAGWRRAGLPSDR